jgi:hypothetical protein
MTKRLGTPGGRWVGTGKKDDDDGPAVSVSELMAQTKDSLTSQMKVPPHGVVPRLCRSLGPGPHTQPVLTNANNNHIHTHTPPATSALWTG